MGNAQLRVWRLTMSPEQLDRVIAVATERYRAMTPADWRRIRREDRWGAVRAWIRWALHI